MQFIRFAIYYAPPPEAPWVRYASNWLGWDMQTGKPTVPQSPSDLPMSLAEITHAPRKYGLHGTLKPPFRLAEEFEPAHLETACAELALSLRPLKLGPLHLTRLGRFLALCPAPCEDLSRLAATCVKRLDRFRAQPTQAELDRRRAASLTPRQKANLTAWGYPYILDDFRFHITLTGRLPRHSLDQVQSVLDRELGPLLPQELTLTDLALTGEDAQGRFHLLRRFDLSG